MSKDIKNMDSDSIIDAIYKNIIFYIISIVCVFLGKISTASTVVGHVFASILFWGGSIGKIIISIYIAKLICTILYKILKYCEK